MARNSGRRYDPAVPKVIRLDLNSEHLGLRIFALAVSIMVAGIAFTYLISNLLAPNTGWQEVKITGSRTAIGEPFLLHYNIGAGEKPAAAEMQQLRITYTKAMEDVNDALSTESIEGKLNLFSLNAAPNQQVTLDPILYKALAQVKQCGSRYPFFAPLIRRYESLCACTNDVDAAMYDPSFAEDAADFAAQCASFAMDPDSVDIILLEDCTAQLWVSDAYLAFAREYELDVFVDFAWLRNAFMADHAAESLRAAGLTNGAISSFDGFCVALGEGEYAVNLFEVSGGTHQTASVTYSGPRSVVSYRAFPLLNLDENNYYTYSDGTVRTPYLSADGYLKAACPNLMVLSSGSCAELAMQTLPAFASDSLDPAILTESGISWAATVDGKAASFGTGFSVHSIS